MPTRSTRVCLPWNLVPLSELTNAKFYNVSPLPIKTLKRSLLILLAVITTSLAQARETVYLYTYHNKPPFVVDMQAHTGLYFDLADLLTAKSEKYLFITIYIPRKRIDHFIENELLDGVVLGASPIWFKDKGESRFLWLPPFYDDSDEFVSRKEAPFEFTGRASLKGKIIAGVAGYYYFGINEAVESGELKRIDTVGEKEVLSLIEKGRADMGIVSQSVFRYLKKQKAIPDGFHFSGRKHDEFQRRAFTSLSNTAVHAEMAELLNKVKEDGSWARLVNNYQ